MTTYDTVNLKELEWVPTLFWTAHLYVPESFTFKLVISRIIPVGIRSILRTSLVMEPAGNEAKKEN